MSGSAPTDLAVAFTSVERRLREALAPVGGDRTLVAAQLGELDATIAAAAALLGCAADSATVASAIRERPADSWGADLDQLQQIGLRLGRALRAVEEEAERAAD